MVTTNQIFDKIKILPFQTNVKVTSIKYQKSVKYIAIHQTKKGEIYEPLN